MNKRILLVGGILALLAWPVAAALPGIGRANTERSTKTGKKTTISREEKVADKSGPEERRVPAENQASTRPAPAEPAEERPKAAKQEDKNILLVNKGRSLPSSYVPADLRPVQIPFNCPADSPKRLLREEAATALERLVDQAARDGMDLVGVSGYRSYQRQQDIYAAQVERRGEKEANRVSARPGESEHQTGLAIDVSSPVVGGQLTQSLGETAAGRWLAENAPAYGFIIRYPAGKEAITGYQYEPWHLRYIGTEHARAVAGQGLTLEEYLGG